MRTKTFTAGESAGVAAVDAAAIPDLVPAAEMIDLQLLPPASVEVVLPRAHAQVLAVLLGDLLGREGGRR